MSQFVTTLSSLGWSPEECWKIEWHLSYADRTQSTFSVIALMLRNERMASLYHFLLNPLKTTVSYVQQKWFYTVLKLRHRRIRKMKRNIKWGAANIYAPQIQQANSLIFRYLNHEMAFWCRWGGGLACWLSAPTVDGKSVPTPASVESQPYFQNCPLFPLILVLMYILCALKITQMRCIDGLLLIWRKVRGNVRRYVLILMLNSFRTQPSESNKSTESSTGNIFFPSCFWFLLAYKNAQAFWQADLQPEGGPRVRC